MNIGQRIKQRRIELNLSVDDLAKALNKNRATVYRYESNEIENMPANVLESLAKILQTTPAHLMGWEDNSNLNKIIGTEFGAPYTKANEMMKTHLNGVLRWITDKLQSPKDTILLTKHFDELLLGYKKLIERYLQANLLWNKSSEIIIKEYKEKYPNINEDEIISKYFQNELSLEINNICNKIQSLPTWRRIYYDDL
ncbi:helix-turn-helix transcriptional regulator [Peptoniphilus sp. AGMB00490]|uniref:Helix-turn-helix transcriptional regulator n=1 Tax=Peptoniphilus faecalis TaxID=2731255 RepID=A0A848RMD9_9FIRM|nr:helix-turn-helix transcriptional regulator [Peptoniphilus faecalis]MDD6906313.1 helix-turn-helix transcriptional regulator [Finegoldia magna]NMW85452.1 helix-turn-helix transcriptional regulator [Peptoniphilus faecalis]